MACVAVVGLHTSIKDLSAVNAVLYYLCGFAVPLFFMASGYILLQRDNIEWNYALRKWKTILHVVLLWGALGGMAVFLHGIVVHKSLYAIVYGVLKMLLGGLLQKGFFWQFWFFGALLIVYAVSLFISRMKTQSRIALWAICFLIGEIMQISSMYVGASVQSYIIQTLRVWSWMQYFLLGGFIPMLLGYVKHVSLNKHVMALLIWIACLLCYQFYVGTFILNPAAGKVQFAEYFYDSFFDVIWLVLLFSFVMRLNLGEKSKCVIGFFNPLLMGIYIIHPFVLRLFNHFVTITMPVQAAFLFFFVLIVSSILVKFMQQIPLANKLIRL